jgi:hypothetical protein
MQVRVRRETKTEALLPTEYEFSLIADDPVARILGEYSLEYIVFAWQVSIMKKISL